MAGKDVNVTIRSKNEARAGFQGATSELDTFKNKIGGLLNPLTLLKTAIAGLGIATLGELLKKSVEAAGGAEAAWTRVASAIDALGGHSVALKGQLEGLFQQIQKTTRYSDDEAASAFARLLTISGDYAGSVKNLTLVADVAANKQIDLTEAAELVGKVMAGTGMRGLKEFGITATNATDGIRQLRAQLTGFAENDGKTAQGRLHQIANAFDDVLEAIGRAVLGGEGTSGGMNAFAEALEKFAKWIDDNSEPIKQLADNLARFIGGLTNLPETLQNLRLPNFTAGNAIDLLKGTVRFLFGQRTQPLDVTYVPLQPNGSDLRGAAPPPRAHELTPEELKALEKERKREASLGIYQDLSTRLGLRLQGTPGATPGIPLPNITSPTVSVGPGAGGGFGGDFKVAFDAATESVKGLNTELQSTGDLIGETLGKAVVGFADTWAQAIDSIIQGHESLANAIIKAARRAIGQALAAEGQATILKAIAAAAEGLFNPAKLFQAAKLFAAGSAELAFASVLSGGGGGGYGGGGGGSYAAGVSSAADSVTGKGHVTVVLNGSRFLLDKNDPSTLDEFKAMLQQLYGTRDIDFVFQGA